MTPAERIRLWNIAMSAGWDGVGETAAALDAIELKLNERRPLTEPITLMSATPDELRLELVHRRVSNDDPLVAMGLPPAEEAVRETSASMACAAVLGRRGGVKGGPARSAAMTQEERAASASKAARARWANPARNENPGGRKRHAS